MCPPEGLEDTPFTKKFFFLNCRLSLVPLDIWDKLPSFVRAKLSATNALPSHIKKPFLDVPLGKLLKNILSFVLSKSKEEDPGGPKACPKVLMKVIL